MVFLLRPWLALASNHEMILDAVLGSWQGNTGVQFVLLRMTADGQGKLSRGASLIFDDVTGSPASRRFFTFTSDVAKETAGTGILIASEGLFALTGVQPDFVLPAGALAPGGGRVCYLGDDGVSPQSLDCVAYGRFRGDVGSFGPPVRATPENRALVRVGATGLNRTDFRTELSPVVRNNAGAVAILETLCGNAQIEQGEECDGTNLGGKTCASLGFAPGGTLGCVECHVDTSGCSNCGNGTIDRGEQCDLDDLGGRDCLLLGFTGGALDCTAQCKITTAGCDPTYFVPGGGPRASDCSAEWRITNASGRPGVSGRAPVRQVCRDGDAGCDADAITGQCTFRIAVCVGRTDARLPVGSGACRPKDTATWTLLRPSEGDAVATLVTAVGALGSSTVAGSTVTFDPPLAATEQCTGELSVVVPRVGTKSGKLALRARAASAAGRGDSDTLRLVCTR